MTAKRSLKAGFIASANPKTRISKGYHVKRRVADDAPLTDAELASMRPAREVLPESFFKNVERERNLGGRPRLEHPKRQVTLRIDQDVIDKFKSDGEGWQRRMNDALRKAAGV